MYMKERSAGSRMESLFVSYRLLLCRYDLSWVTCENEKIILAYVLSTIRLELPLRMFSFHFQPLTAQPTAGVQSIHGHAIQLFKVFYVGTDGPQANKNTREGKIL